MAVCVLTWPLAVAHTATYLWLNLVAGPSEAQPLVMKFEADIVPGKL